MSNSGIGTAAMDQAMMEPHTRSADEIAHEAMIDTGDLTDLEHALEKVMLNERLRRYLIGDRTTSEGTTDFVTQLFGRIKVAKIRTELRVRDAK